MKLAVANKFNSLEKPKQLTLLKDAFSQDDDLITPTMKLKRNVAKKHFQAQIDQMYSTPAMAPTKR